MIHIKTIPAVYTPVNKNMLLAEETDVERSEIDGTLYISQETGSVTLTFDQLEAAYLAAKENER